MQAARRRKPVGQRLAESRVLGMQAGQRRPGQGAQVLRRALHLRGDHVRGDQRQAQEAGEQEEAGQEDEGDDGDEQVRHEHLRPDAPHEAPDRPAGEPGQAHEAEEHEDDDAAERQQLGQANARLVGAN